MWPDEKKVGIGHQDFETIRRDGYFYVDKTDFIRQWWESGDSVTLITRPRRFGKTLNMSMLEPRNPEDDGMILEFKVFRPKKENSLEDTVKAALDQINSKDYDRVLIERGISKERIRHYGFAFQGKQVLIGQRI